MYLWSVLGPFLAHLGGLEDSFGHTLNPIKGTLGSLGNLLGGENSGRPPWPRLRCVVVFQFLLDATVTISRDRNPSIHSAGPIDSRCATFLTCTRKCARLCPYFCHFLALYGPMGPPVDANMAKIWLPGMHINPPNRVEEGTALTLRVDTVKWSENVEIRSYRVTPNVGFILFLPHIYKGPPGVWLCTCGAFWCPFWPILGAFRIAFGHTLNPIRGTLGSLGMFLVENEPLGGLPGHGYVV